MNKVYFLMVAVVAGCAAQASEPNTKGGNAKTVNIKNAGMASSGVQEEAREFLDFYTQAWLELYAVAAGNDWVAGTDVSDANTAASVASNKSLAAFTGNPYVVKKIDKLLKEKGTLTELQILQLGKMKLAAAENPGTIPEIVKMRIEAEGRQRNTLDGFVFKMKQANGGEKVVTPNIIEGVLRESKDLDERRRAWDAAKGTGPVLKAGLVDLQKLRNQVARELGYESFFALQVADYGMTPPEMMQTIERILTDIQPLYEQLHCWAKRELAKRYNQPVPKRIPAHWLTNRWGQEWPGLVAGIDLNPLFKGMKPEELIQKAEAFYVSLGFAKLPSSFWTKSDLYELPAGSARKKNTHASAWHLDLRDDIRSLMSVTNDFEWFTTTHHELGHIYYYISYTNTNVPPLLRQGANRAFHEGIGELISLAASQQPYLREVGVLKDDTKIDSISWLLNDALTSVVFLPFSAGVMTHFEHDLYQLNLSPGEFNKRWWSYVQKYQGIDPPQSRGEEFCDAATKTHINDDPAQYYDYALATILKFQLHDYISKKILHKDPHDVSYYNSKEAGAFLKKILEPGASKDWRKLLKEATGEDLSGRAMLEYYAPLLEWLKKENAGADASFR
ncbi:MAG: M2 family metallopeptidase [Planctomycetota bacterium]